MVASRYVVEHVLGKGGMGSVYAVRDTKLERVVALKYLKREAARENGPAAALFQREFHTLAQLRHPRVIQVYDYGIDGERPFYTMELLDGSDMRELAPVPWRRACQLLRDVASSLALLHSRRLLHRDLSPRNVRCTRDGQAKLIDFGTMTAMGIARDVAGTPPYMAPEAVHNHPLDARTDLYALGTLAYWTLTGYDAYPARDTRELRALWVKPVVPPSTLARDVPDALDALVMSLLSLDPHARPSHVAEVIERLTAIAGLEPIEHMDVARAYVVTPTLIGHSETLGSFHKRLVRASRGRGSAMWIEGAAGLGRSRLLQSLALEAKLSGVLVLLAEGAGAHRGELAITRALLEGIVDAAPEQALIAFEKRAAVLGHLLPHLIDKLAIRPALHAFDDPAERIAMLDHAARGFVLEIADARSVMIALDDFDKADEASKVCIALLSRDASEHKLVVCASALADPGGGSMRPRVGLAESAARLELKAFNAEQTERLVRSVFGEAPHLRAVAQWAHALSQGVPETILELLQYLVDHRIARYERGSWTLPESLRDQPLPASVEQACEQLIAELSERARTLAHPFALLTEHGALELDEIAQLSALPAPQDIYGALLELESAGVVMANDGFYMLRRRGLERAVLKTAQPEHLRALHGRLGAVYQARSQQLSDEALLLAAHHWRLAGDGARSFAALGLVADVESTRFGRTPHSIATHVAALEHALHTGAAPAQVYPLQRALVQLAASADLGLVRHAAGALSRLVADCGRADFDALGNAAHGASKLEPAARIRQAIGVARSRYESASSSPRGLEPTYALNELGYVASVLTGAYATRGEVDSLQHLASVIAPLCSLSVGFDVLHEILGQAIDSLSGRDVLARRRETLARLQRAGAHELEPRARTSAEVALSYWSAMDEAVQGSSDALEHAEALAARPGFAPLAARVRSVFCLFTGDEQGAESCRKQREVLTLGDPWGVTLTDARGALYEAWGYYLCGSVLGMRRVLAAVNDIAVRVQGWQRELGFVRGLYALLRGEPERALPDLERSGYAGPHALALIGAGDAAQALRVAETALEGSPADPTASELFAPNRWLACSARALALAELGDPRAAKERLARDISEAERLGLAGMLVCVMHEAAARVAIANDDHVAFRAHVRKLGVTYGRGTSGLRSRYEHLGVIARKALMSVPPPPVQKIAREAERDAEIPLDPRTQIERSGSGKERVARSLRLLVESAQAERGYLFGMQQGGLRLAGSLGDEPPPEGIEDMLAFYMNAELESGSATPHTVTGTYAASPDLVAWISDGQHLYFPVLLACTHEQRRVIAGVVVLALAAQNKPAIPGALVAEISRALIAAGDVIYAHAAE